MRRAAGVVVFGLSLALARAAAADPILPPDPALDALAKGFQRQQDVFATAENGLSLDVIVNPGDVATVQSFFAQTASDDFQAVTGKHPYQVMAEYGEHGDEGNFAGISSVGVAARLMTLERDGAPVDEIGRARDAAIRAARAWHVYGSIGGPCVVARGVRRTTPLDPAAPPLPGMLPDRVPLKDAQGNPLPATKEAVWRDPVASGFDGWIWFDDTSKDQVSGYALATAWLWDALHGDPAVPADVTKNLEDDLRAFANALRQVAPELGIDLCIRDADGRLTTFHDLNPRQINPTSVAPPNFLLKNGFNAALALGIIRAAIHVTGDVDLEHWYYDDLVGTRDLPKDMAQIAGIIFIGAPTNFSNVNMLAIALATLGRFETDAYVRQRLADTLEHGFWSTGDSRDVSHVKQAWFDVVYGAYAPLGPAANVRPRMQEDLGGFQPAPAFERDRVNCDANEIAAGVCTAVDGMTMITLDKQMGHGGGVVATQPLPMSIRPDSDFEWRSDPFDVNGNASTLMDPRGDWLTAYWLGRLSDTDPSKNLSPNARPALPYTFVDGGAGDDDAGPPAAAPTSSGCGCRAADRDGVGAWSAIAALVGVVTISARGARRRRSGSRRRSDRA